ncbi:hypothetical protein SDC9_48794 [bioreactor metagenome]|uniref:Glycosyltransferase RgtA/B/C/D-like domain-containing protein n=1 Tax=bioreactor metagenome TaxID=1076179 RepID=A0A644WFC0_9ZZZZ
MHAAEILYCLALIAVVTLLILKWRSFSLPGIRKRWVLAAFYLKVLAGLGLTYIYTSYYPDRSKADIFKYFDDSEVMYQSIHSSPSDYLHMVSGINNDNRHFDTLYYSKMNNWYRKYETVTYNDSHTIIRINAVIRLVSFGFFQVHNLIFIILSFIGLLALYKTFCRYFTEYKYWLFAAVFMIPSVIFWSSGAMKESILFFAIGVFLYSFQQILFSSICMKWFLLAAVGIFFLFFTKMYVLAVLVPVLAANLWIVLTGNRHALAKQIISLLFFVNLAVLIGWYYPAYNVFDLFVGKQHDFVGLARFENAGSLIEPVPVEPHFSSFLLYSPQAIVNTLFRPYPWEISSFLMLPAIAENLLLMLFVILAVFFHKKEIRHARIIWFCVFFALGLSVITGITTPVLGALVRYRVPLLPFLYIAVFLIIDFRRVQKFFGLKKSV